MLYGLKTKKKTNTRNATETEKMPMELGTYPEEIKCKCNIHVNIVACS